MSKITLGQKLKEIRMKSGVSQGELAKKLGYGSPQFISNWERDLCSIPLVKVIPFCRLTETPVSDMRTMLVLEATRKIDSALKVAIPKKKKSEKPATHA